MGDRAVNEVVTFDSGQITTVSATGPDLILQVLALDAQKTHMWFEVHNGDAAIAFDKFVLQVRAHPAAAWIDYIDTWATGTTQVHTSATLNILGATLKGSSYVNIGPCDGIQFLASGAAANIDTCRVIGRIWRA